MAIFLYFIYKEKWPKMGLKIAIKWPKMLQISWNWDQTCISMSFIKFQKIFGKFSKLADFWPKNHHLARFSRRDFETFFSTEIVSGPSKTIWFGWKSVYLLPIMCLTRLTMGFGWFRILATLWAFKVAERADFRQNGLKMTKIRPLGNFQLIWNIFGHFMAILRPILGHFSLYIKYRKIAIFYRTYTHVCF